MIVLWIAKVIYQYGYWLHVNAKMFVLDMDGACFANANLFSQRKNQACCISWTTSAFLISYKSCLWQKHETNINRFKETSCLFWEWYTPFYTFWIVLEDKFRYVFSLTGYENIKIFGCYWIQLIKKYSCQIRICIFLRQHFMSIVRLLPMADKNR